MLNLPSFITRSSLIKIILGVFILVSLILAGELVYWRRLHEGLQRKEKGATFYQELLDHYSDSAFKSESVLLSLAPAGQSGIIWVIKGQVEQINNNMVGVSSEETIPAWVKIENVPVYLFDKSKSPSILEEKLSTEEIKTEDFVIIHIDEPEGSDFTQFQYRAKAILKII